jgi:hypothetical protein
MRRVVFLPRIFFAMASVSNKQIELYRLIMAEIKERCEVVQAVAEQRVNVWPVAAYEMGFLQLRLICELVGLGCLAAHGDIPATYSKRLMTTYEPGKIFAELTKLHPNFYPRACANDMTAQGGTSTIKILDDHQSLSKEQLIALHGKTGNVLHRGRLKDVGRGFHLNFDEIREYRNRIVDMLRIHLISLYDPTRYVAIIMSDPQTGNVAAAEIKMLHASDSWMAEEAQRRRPEEKK